MRFYKVLTSLITKVDAVVLICHKITVDEKKCIRDSIYVPHVPMWSARKILYGVGFNA